MHRDKKILKVYFSLWNLGVQLLKFLTIFLSVYLILELAACQLLAVFNVNFLRKIFCILPTKNIRLTEVSQHVGSKKGQRLLRIF